MCRMIEQNFIRFEGDKSLIRPVFAADSVDELPEKEGLDGFILDIGSAAWVVPEKAVYAMDGSGEWVRQGG